MNAELDEVNKWTLSNFLFINKRKTEFVIFGTDARLSKATDTVAIKIGDYEINRVYDFKYLGIVLNNSLTWKDHVRYVISKVGKRVGVLGRLRRNITIHAAFEMYNSLILICPFLIIAMLFGPAAIKQIWKVLNLCKGGPRKL